MRSLDQRLRARRSHLCAALPLVAKLAVVLGALRHDFGDVLALAAFGAYVAARLEDSVAVAIGRDDIAIHLYSAHHMAAGDNFVGNGVLGATVPL